MRVYSAPAVVGRDAELAVGADAVRQLGEGHSSVLAIEGEAGIGKTRLVRSLIDDARSRDLAVFSGQAHPFERTRPFGVITAALGLSARSPDPRRAAIGALLAGPGTGDVQYRVVEEIVDLVETACAQRPVLLIAEDIHWADGASLLAVLSIARQLQLAPLLVVVTARPSPLPPDAARLLDDLSAGGGRTLRLQPLSAGSVELLAGHVLGAPPGPTLTTMLAKTGGNPLWATAMLRSLADEGLLRRAGNRIEATSPELPASLSDLVVRRLRHLPRATLDLLQVTAVLGDSVSLRDVAAVARRPPAEVAGQLNEAFDAQLLDEVDERVAFRHQLVHDAIYQHTPASVRRLLHREAAVALMAVGADRLDVADHLILGAERGDEQAFEWLREAARDASRSVPVGHPRIAPPCRGAPARRPPRRRPCVGRGGAGAAACRERRRGVGPRRSRARPTARGRGGHPVARRARRRACPCRTVPTRSSPVTRAYLADPALLQPSERVLMLAQQSWALTYTGDPRGGESAATTAQGIAEQAGDPAMTVWALTALLVAVGRQGRYGEALAHARRAAVLAADTPDMRSLPLQPKFFLGLALFDCDLVHEARAAFRAALDDEFGSGWWLSETLLADAQASFVLGDWEDAVPGLIAGGERHRRRMISFPAIPLPGPNSSLPKSKPPCRWRKSPSPRS